ncbi:tannase/feruloyl esterase family alpha/beta hydrolase [Paludibaculum fermentans]|uniref:Tannase/feruloyl esterase family alpha/beta hydrolase n=1 Tax=Paludibaculum fermentans TaxID=1473598 RepID=A0A7S7NW69_PALFE|nr:tannase/feruloyl esterase family alpha/beta hydrolase [Paludibaculum fermentans]QOY90917.1 tannase/feruloyl esterase family alpha/beta hydrolase [Paludibaculum fermentans]
MRKTISKLKPLFPLFCAAALSAQVVPLRDWPVPAPTGKPAILCADLRSLTNFEYSVVSATVVDASTAAPEHCQVRIFIQPALNIEVKLPTAWNGRLYMFGNGGWAGESFESPGRLTTAARGLKAGFVTASTDTGHSAAAEPGASFALNRQELLDYGFRSLHLTAELAKLMARTFYGEAPRKSYYEGCSQGGRQGLTLAQRFPNDFDGIIAGAPGLFQTATHLSRAYWMQGMNANPFPASKLGLLAQVVYDKCDARDGLKDGLIEDPRRCDFKPARDLPRCAAGVDGADCVTADQVKSLERIYSDVMSHGKRFFPGWPVGPEVAGPNGQSGWIGQEIPGSNGPGAWTSYGYNFLRYVAPAVLGGKVDDNPAEAFRLFDIDSAPPQVEELRQVIDANDPDLTAFRKHGGKLLMYFGWADPQLNPLMGVEYYERVLAAMGDSTTDFFRLFMVPGMFHCGGGVGTSQFDATTPLLNWVEQAKAPTRIEAARVVQGNPVRTRPLCAYPQVARYKGSGSIDEAANFTCVQP